MKSLINGYKRTDWCRIGERTGTVLMGMMRRWGCDLQGWDADVTCNIWGR